MNTSHPIRTQHGKCLIILSALVCHPPLVQLVSPCRAASTQPTQPAEITATIDWNAPGVPLPADLRGVNVDAEDANEPNYHGVERYGASLGPLATPLVRYPGGLVGNFFRWAQTLGPLEERTKQWNCFHFAQFIPHLGAAEFLTLLDQLRARGMIIVNVTDGTPEEAAAWVAFCRGRLGDPRPLGTDAAGTDWKTVGHWAQRRADLTGLREPVNVAYWELGNELVDGKNFRTAGEYVAKALPYAKKIREVDPQALLGWQGWDAKVPGADRALLDFVIVHNYTGWPKYGDKHVMWKSGILTGRFTCAESGTYTIELRLAGMGINEAILAAKREPQVDVSIDGKVLEHLTLMPQSRMLRYKQELSAGEHALEINFLNDFCEGGDDTNVEVGKTFTVARGETKATYTFPDKESDIREDLKTVRQTLADVDGYCARELGPDVFVALTEYNRMEYACFDLATALYVAEYQRILTDFPRVRAACIWEACSLNFGIKASSTGVERPVYHVMAMLQYLQDRKVPARIEPPVPNDDLRILATKASMGDQAAVLVINLGERPQQLLLPAPPGHEPQWRQKESISGHSLADDNEGKPKVTPRTEVLKADRLAGPQVPIPPYSVTLLTGRARP